MNVEKVVIVINNGQDRLTLETDLPPAHRAYACLELHFEALPGTGMDYALRNFPEAVIEVIDAKTGRITQHLNKTTTVILPGKG